MVEGATLVTVLRHGAVAGRPFVYRGRLDDPLSQLGWQQMEATPHITTPNIAITHIATSPLQRCRAYAQRLAEHHGVPLHVAPAFQEMAFGEWEGLTPEEAAARDPEAHARFRAGAAAPGGESLSDVRERVRAGWQEWLTDAHGGHRLLVTHAGVMRALLLELLDLPASSIGRIALAEAAWFRVSLLAGAAPILLQLNSCAD